MDKLNLLIYIPLIIIFSIIALPLAVVAFVCEAFDDAINGNSDSYYHRYL